MSDLFDLVDLPSWLQVPQVDEQTAIRVRRYADGWLMAATGLTSWPDPVPNNLWAWAIELAGIAFRNPAGATSESIDDYQVSHDRARRAEILAEAKAVFGGASQPQFSFPEWDWHWVAVEPTNVLTD